MQHKTGIYINGAWVVSSSDGDDRRGELWDGGDRAGALEAIPDSVVDDLVVHGSPEECRARILRYTNAGVEIPIVMPLPVGMSTHEAALRLSPAGG